MKKAFPLLALLVAAAGCNQATPTQAAGPAGTAPAAAAPTDSLQQAVATYIKANGAEFPGYEPVRWGAPIVYTRQSEAAIKGVVAMKVFDDALVPRNKALANYKASVARHDPAARTKAIMAVYGKANKYNDSLLIIANSFIGVKDTTRLGTQLAHTFRRQDKAGALVLDSASFVVHRGGRVEML